MVYIMKDAKIIFMGTASFSKQVLEKLLENNYNVVAVVTQPDRFVGRKKVLTMPEVKEVALASGIPVYQPLKIKEEYQEITMPFENIIKDQWKDSEEENFQKLKPDEDDMQRMSDIPLSFNYDRFLTGYSKTLFPLTCRNQKNLRLIGELATIHGISEMDMRKYVSQSMNLKDNTLNAELLKRKVRNAKRSVMVDLDVKNPYALPPVRFLQSKQHGIEVSRSDAYLIETLITDFKMKPEVVNVLIEYVLEKTNQRFSKSYVEKIASVWVRLNIDTSEKALAHIKEEEQKPIKTKKKELPEWFQQEDEGSEKANKTVDDKELEEMMERLRGE